MTERNEEMIYPTEMTVATGTTVYAGDPASGERIVSREVRVSVTFQIDDEEADLADLAFAKAAEVERARIAAQERIERRPTGLEDPFDAGDPALVPPDEDKDDNVRNGENRNDDGGPESDDGEEEGGPLPPSGIGHPGVRYAQNMSGGYRGCTMPASPHAVPEGAAETDWATRPQVLALGSHFRRLGIGLAEQTALLRARFGKFRPERLTREEAARLMRSLERGEIEFEDAGSGPTGSGIPNADGRRQAATPA